MMSLATIVSAVALVSGHSAPAALQAGAQLGTMSIPSIGLTTPITEGSMAMYSGKTQYLSELKYGPAHYPANALPWQQGTVAFAGHRVTNSRPFENLGMVRLNDIIVIRTAWGISRYKVVAPPKGHSYAKSGYPVQTSPCALRIACGIVWHSAGWFFRWHLRGHWLLLTACTPQHDDRYRLLVFAKRV
jgi:sortase A